MESKTNPHSFILLTLACLLCLADCTLKTQSGSGQSAKLQNTSSLQKASPQSSNLTDLELPIEAPDFMKNAKINHTAAYERYKELISLLIPNCANKTPIKAVNELFAFQFVDLSHRNLQRIPPGLFELPNLKAVDLSYNRIEIFPKGTQIPEKLTYLNLSNNLFTHIPVIIFKIPLLSHLDLSGNSIEDISEYAFNCQYFKGLNTFVISTLLLKSTDVWINLESLDLSRNFISVVPEYIFKLNKLRSINLSHNQIKECPLNWISDRLIRLDLSSNYLKSFEAHMPRLQNLNLSDNFIEDIPGSISEYHELIHLNLSQNALKELPSVLHLPRSLRSLRLSGNLLKNLKASTDFIADTLEYIDLSDNFFQTFPLQIKNLVNLKFLDLSRNRIAKTPEWMNSFKKLEYLDLSDNVFDPKSISVEDRATYEFGESSNRLKVGSFITEIGSLVTLKLRRTDLSEFGSFSKSIQKEYFPKLEELDLGYCRLIKIPEWIFGLVNLKVLNFKGNELVKIPPEIQKLEFLESLDLSENKIEKLGCEISTLRNLQVLNLAFNNFSCSKYDFSEMNRLVDLDLSNKLQNCAELLSISVFNRNGEIELKRLTLKGQIRMSPSFQILGCSFAKIDYLNLAGCNLRAIPEWLTSSLEVSHLDLSYNQITDPWSALSSQRSIKILNLENNTITKIGNLDTLATTLVALSLSNNPVKSLPQWLSMLINLRSFFLVDCPITECQLDLEDLRNLDLIVTNTPLCFFKNRATKFRKAKLHEIVIPGLEILQCIPCGPTKDLRSIQIALKLKFEKFNRVLQFSEDICEFFEPIQAGPRLLKMIFFEQWKETSVDGCGPFESLTELETVKDYSKIRRSDLIKHV